MIKSPRGGGKKGKGKGVEVEEHPHHDKKPKTKKGIRQKRARSEITHVVGDCD